MHILFSSNLPRVSYTDSKHKILSPTCAIYNTLASRARLLCKRFRFRHQSSISPSCNSVTVSFAPWDLQFPIIVIVCLCITRTGRKVDFHAYIQKRFKRTKENSSKQGWYSWNHIPASASILSLPFTLNRTAATNINNFLLFLFYYFLRREHKKKRKEELVCISRFDPTHNGPYIQLQAQPDQPDLPWRRCGPLNVGPGKILGPNARTIPAQLNLEIEADRVLLGKKKRDWVCRLYLIAISAKETSILPFSPIDYSLV